MVAWIKKAGYATDPRYAEKLIDIMKNMTCGSLMDQRSR